MTPIKMPTYAELTAQMGATFNLQNADGLGASAVLIDAYEGIAMNARFQCYSAQFALPHGVQLPQAVYAVHAVQSSKEVEWPLLLTPVMPGEDGRARMEAVFHVPSKAVASGAKPEVAEERGPAGSLVS